MPKSRFFRVAVEGATTDGRTVDRNWLLEMAQTYNRVTYAARVNLEHIRGITADPPFQSYGDVLSLKTETFDLDVAGKTEKRTALLAEIEALDPLIKMNAARQKLYTSIEIAPNFAGTGKAYLMGIAVTDSPASLGTEMLQFCAQKGEASPLAARKQDKDNLFSETLETQIELTEDAVDPDPTGLFASFKTFIEKYTGKSDDAAKTATVPEVSATGDFDTLVGLVGRLSDTVQASAKLTQAAQAKLEAEVASLTTSFATIKADVEKTAETGFTARPRATGGADLARTDC